MTSVVIAAYNEEEVLGPCLRRLMAPPTDLHVVVVPNGCQDRTAEVARSVPGVTVVEQSEAGKSRALNRGDAAARGFPRAYVDADIRITGAEIERLSARLTDGVLAVAPTRDLRADGCSWAVQAYASVHRRLPVMASSLFGRGCVVLSEEGRARFDRFPDVTADDLFLDRLFVASEKVVVDDVVVVVELPRTTRALFSRLARVRRGNRALRAAATETASGVGASGPSPGGGSTAWLRVVLRDPRLILAGLVYGALSGGAELRARFGADRSWGRTERP